MKSTFNPIPLLIILILGLAGCSAAGKTVKKGESAYEAGNHFLAANYFLDALDLKPGYSKAIAGIGKCAEAGYNQKLQLAEGYRENGDLESALAEYKQLHTYLSRLRRHNVLAFTPINTAEIIEQTSAGAAEEHYQEAEALFVRAQYRAAIETYEAALALSQPYKDAREKIAQSYFNLADGAMSTGRYREAAENYLASNEWVSSTTARERAASLYYELGRHFLDQQLCRKAYEDLQRAWQINQGLNDVSVLMDRAKECATINIAFVEIENKTGRSISGMDLSDIIFEYVKGQTQQEASQFIRLLDRQQLNLLMREQQISERMLFNSTRLPDNIQGVDYFIVGKLNQVSVDQSGPDTRRIRDTYEYEVRETYLDGDGKKKTRRKWVPAEMTYDFTEGSIRVKLSGSVNVISAQTSEIVIAQPLEMNAQDAIQFAHRFSLRHDPDRFKIRFNDQVDNLRQAKKQLTPPDELVRPLIENFSYTVADQIVAKLDQAGAPPDPHTIVISFQEKTTVEPVEEQPVAGKPNQEVHVLAPSSELQQVQSWLNSLGYSCGSADGLMGAKTRGCLTEFQNASGLSASGELDEPTLQSLKRIFQ